MEALLAVVLPVALIVATGYWIGKRVEIDLGTLSRLSIYVLVPALMFDAMYRATLPGNSVWGIVAGYTLTYLGLYLVSLLVARVQGLSTLGTKSLITTSLFPNSGNMGLSLSLFAFGQGGLERAVVYFIASAVVMFGLGPAFLRGGRLWESTVFTLRQPLFWGLAGGILLRGTELPFDLDKGVQMLAQACIPVLLCTLGMQIARTQFRVGRFEFTSSLIRLGVGPAMAWGVGSLLGLSTLDTSVLVLQTAMPIAVNAFLMVGEFGGQTIEVARAVVVSTVVAFASIPLWLLLLGVG
jgi:predicted permease